jgi:hypothetical protein
LNGCLTNANIQSLAVPPKDFKEVVETNVWMVGQIGTQHRTDPETGLEMGPESDPDLICMITGSVWNSQNVTLVKSGKEGESPNMMVLEQFALAVSLIPAGKDMRYDTHSDWLVEQWHNMMGWKDHGYVGLDRDACMPQWTEILKYIDEGPRGAFMVKIDENTTDSAVLEAAQMYATEGLQRLQEDRETMVDGYRQPEAPRT